MTDSRAKGQRIQREFVNEANERGIESCNMDKGSIHCPLGDVLIGEYWFSVKGRKSMAEYIFPEKPREVGTLLKPNNGGKWAVIPFEMLLELMGGKR
jgi:hypothetical protein